jgi:hypothetical protein
VRPLAATLNEGLARAVRAAFESWPPMGAGA